MRYFRLSIVVLLASSIAQCADEEQVFSSNFELAVYAIMSDGDRRWIGVTGREPVAIPPCRYWYARPSDPKRTKGGVRALLQQLKSQNCMGLDLSECQARDVDLAPLGDLVPLAWRN